MFTCFSWLSLGRVNNSYGGPQYDNVVKGDLWSNDTNPTSSTDIMTINVEHVGQKEDLYVNDTKECDNMYSNTELNEKISKLTKKGALDSQPQVMKLTSCLPMVGGSLRLLRLLPPLKLVAMI